MFDFGDFGRCVGIGLRSLGSGFAAPGALFAGRHVLFADNFWNAVEESSLVVNDTITLDVCCVCVKLKNKEGARIDQGKLL